VITNNKRSSNSIILIYVMKSDSLVLALVVAFTALQSHQLVHHTRLVHNYLRPLSCQRPWPSATLTTWTSLLYVSLTNSLECQDATLLESLSYYTQYFIIKRVFSMKFSHQVHMLSHNNHNLMLNTSNTVSKHHIIHAHYTTCSWRVKQSIM